MAVLRSASVRRMWNLLWLVDAFAIKLRGIYA